MNDTGRDSGMLAALQRHDKDQQFSGHQVAFFRRTSISLGCDCFVKSGSSGL